MEFAPVKLIKVTWQFCFRRSIHRLQLPFYLTPDALYDVAVCSSIRVNKVFRVVDHQVDVAYIVEVKVWRGLVRNNGTNLGKYRISLANTKTVDKSHSSIENAEQGIV